MKTSLLSPPFHIYLFTLKQSSGFSVAIFHRLEVLHDGLLIGRAWLFGVFVRTETEGQASEDTLKRPEGRERGGGVECPRKWRVSGKRWRRRNCNLNILCKNFIFIKNKTEQSYSPTRIEYCFNFSGHQWNPLLRWLDTWESSGGGWS